MEMENKKVNNKLPDNGSLICGVVKYMYDVRKPMKLVEVYEQICAGYKANAADNDNWNEFMDCITYLIAGEGARIYNIIDATTGETAAYVALTQTGCEWYETNKEKMDKNVSENQDTAEDAVNDAFEKFFSNLLAGLGDEKDEKAGEDQKAAEERVDKATERLLRDIFAVKDSEEESKEECEDFEVNPCDAFPDLLSLLAAIGKAENDKASSEKPAADKIEPFSKPVTSKQDTKEMLTRISRQCTLLQLACQDALAKENLDRADYNNIREQFRKLSEREYEFENIKFG